MDTVNIDDKKIKVVYNKKTGKMIPFREDDITGEIFIIATGYVQNEDDIIVGMVSTKRIDWLDGYVREEGVTIIEEK